MQGNVIGLIELEPAPEDALAESACRAEDTTLADTMRRLACEAGPVAVDETEAGLSATAELFDSLAAPTVPTRWSPRLLSCLTRISIDQAALRADLKEELRQLLDRLLAAR